MGKAKLISPVSRKMVPKKKVAAYCRVSSNSADQLNSYANQIKVYTRLIHDMTVAIGDSAEMERAIAMLDEVKESIMNAYEIKTGLSRTKISHLMDAESWFNAKKAVELGFADKILFSDDAKEAGEDEPLEAVMFSRKAVTNSLLKKLMPEKKNGTPIEQLEKRLSLLAH